MRTTTPDRLLQVTVAVVLAGVICAALGLQGFRARATALERARAETTHQAGLQIVHTKLVIADTAIDDDVLRGTDQNHLAAMDFDYALEPAVTGLVVEARAPDDAAELTLANRWLARYTLAAGNARTLAGLGRSGAAAKSLQNASALLRKEVLPRLVTAQAASRARLADDESAADRDALIALLGALLALLVLAGTHWWLTMRTRRIVNLGLAVGLAALLVVSVTGIVVVAAGRTRAGEVRDGPNRVAQDVVEARIAAFDARAGEALGVISGDLPGAEAGWLSAMTTARTALASAADSGSAGLRSDLAATSKLLDGYATVHTQLLAEARAGQDAKVVARAASPTVDGSAGSFADFDATSGALLARQVQAADDGWAAAGRHVRSVGWLNLAIGLLAAAAGWRGLTIRSREYR